MEKEECLLTEKKFRNKLIQHRILPGLQRRHNINTHQPKTEKRKDILQIFFVETR